jgi:AbrB family looped-hinge helix DNA binding protein
MRKFIKVNKRGTVTLPKDIRERLGVEAEGQLVAEETGNGVTLKPAATLPVESYSPEREKEFEANNEGALEEYDL